MNTKYENLAKEIILQIATMVYDQPSEEDVLFKKKRKKSSKQKQKP